MIVHLVDTPPMRVMRLAPNVRLSWFARFHDALEDFGGQCTRGCMGVASVGLQPPE